MEMYEYMTHNRKLKIEEYDDKGNLIDVKEFNKKELFNFMRDQANAYKPLSVARKKDTENFTSKELDIINDLLFYSSDRCSSGTMNREIYWFTEVEADLFREIFNTISKEKLKFIMELLKEDGYMGTFNTNYKSEYFQVRFNFFDALEFINNREGIYYTVNNRGKRIFDFINKPTKRQVQYQRNKNGNRTVFLNFKDWKVYEVIESELT